MTAILTEKMAAGWENQDAGYGVRVLPKADCDPDPDSAKDPAGCRNCQKIDSELGTGTLERRKALFLHVISAILHASEWVTS